MIAIISSSSSSSSSSRVPLNHKAALLLVESADPCPVIKKASPARLGEEAGRWLSKPGS